MRVKVIAYGLLKPLFGSECIEHEFGGRTVEDLLQSLCDDYPPFQPWAKGVACALDDIVVPRTRRLRDQAEIALIPPVGGG